MLSGEERGSARAATVLNAGAAIYVGEEANTLKDGVQAAEAALDSGAARETLAALKAATQGTSSTGL